MNASAPIMHSLKLACAAPPAGRQHSCSSVSPLGESELHMLGGVYVVKYSFSMYQRAQYYCSSG